MPTHAEKIVTQSMLDKMSVEEKQKAEEKGIKFVVVPDDEKHLKKGHKKVEEPPAPELEPEKPKSIWGRLKDGISKI